MDLRGEQQNSGKYRGGTYELVVPQLGFRFNRYAKPDISVQNNQRVLADVRLEWGNLGVLGDDDAYVAGSGKYAAAPSGPTPRMPNGNSISQVSGKAL